MSDPALQLGAVSSDLSAGVARRPAGEVAITEMETRLLRFLIAQDGEPVSRETLLTSVWGYSAKARSRTVDSTIRRLRQEIDPRASHTVRDEARTALAELDALEDELRRLETEMSERGAAGNGLKIAAVASLRITPFVLSVCGRPEPTTTAPNT